MVEMHAPGAPVLLIEIFKDIVSDSKQHKNYLCYTFKIKTIAPTFVHNDNNK